MSGNEIIKYATEQFVRYLDHGPNKKRQKKPPKQQLVYYNRWFGTFPFLIKTALKLRKK